MTILFSQISLEYRELSMQAQGDNGCRTEALRQLLALLGRTRDRIEVEIEALARMLPVEPAGKTLDHTHRGSGV